MNGKRVEYPGQHTLDHHQPGNYWRDDWGHWHAVTPNGLFISLENHAVEEHGDGTISVVDSSILARGGEQDDVWHGHIRHGVWEECR